MRKFITRHYAFFYRFKAFGKVWIFDRGMLITLPLVFLYGLALTASRDIEVWWFVPATALFIFQLIINFGFWFKWLPVRWNDLDIQQTYDYGRYLLYTGQKIPNLAEWELAKEHIENKYGEL